MLRSAINLLFVLVLNASVVLAVFAAISAVGVFRGTVDVLWLARVGLILEVVGLAMFALEYFGSRWLGQGPLRWWLRKLEGIEPSGSLNETWPRQVTVSIGACAIVGGIVLQLVSSFS